MNTLCIIHMHPLRIEIIHSVFSFASSSCECMLKCIFQLEYLYSNYTKLKVPQTIAIIVFGTIRTNSNKKDWTYN